MDAAQSPNTCTYVPQVVSRSYVSRVVDVSVDYYALAYVGYKCSQFLSFSSQDLGTLLRESQARDKKSGFLPGCSAIPDQYAFAMYHMIGT